MSVVLHLIDDPALGGINRVLETQLPALEGHYRHVRQVVDSRVPFCQKFEAEIIVVHFTISWAKLPYLIALRARFSGPLVLVEHSYTAASERHCVPHPKRFRVMLRLGYRLFDRVVAVSHGQAEWLQAARLVLPERLRVIPQCLDLATFGFVPPSLRRHGVIRLGAYGRLVPQKGFDLLIEAMRLIPQDAAVLTIAGYGPDGDALQRQASDLPTVTVYPGKVAPAEFLATVDAVVIPSRWEAYGVVAVESRAAARPILVSAVDGLPEQIKHGGGVAMDASSPALIAAALQHFMGLDIPSMGQAARESVSGHFQDFLNGWHSLIDELTPSKSDYSCAGAPVPRQPVYIGAVR